MKKKKEEKEEKKEEGARTGGARDGLSPGECIGGGGKEKRKFVRRLLDDRQKGRGRVRARDWRKRD